MKKTNLVPKKLRLDLETIRVLQDNELTAIAGGQDAANAVGPIGSFSLSLAYCPNCCGGTKK